MTNDTETTQTEDRQIVREAAEARAAIASEIGKVIVGQKNVLDLLLIALFARGHGLFIGVPGLAKTLLIHTMADSLDLDFKRVQFTPDLMPSDITGTEILEEDHVTGKRVFQFVKGPVFTNILLADEINRTSPKTQAALLQAMQEYRVSVAGVDHHLQGPFLVFATQNPIEQEGTYPLPEAQLDRFMFSIEMTYPSREEEMEIVKRTTSGPPETPSRVLNPERIRTFQETVPRVPVADSAVDHAVRLVRATRPAKDAPAVVREWVSWGAGPRAAQHLVLAAKARAMLDGRFAAGVEDVRAVAMPVLKHRVIPNFKAEAKGMRAGDILGEIIEATRGA